jgi:hypothetical protein
VSEGDDLDFDFGFSVYDSVRKTTQWQAARSPFNRDARDRCAETRMALNQLQDAFNLSEEFPAESGLFIFVPRNNRPQFIASCVLNPERLCSLAQDFSLDLAPHVRPIGRAGCAGIQRSAPALDFSCPGCFDLGWFITGFYL